jgi:hypothetical protein
LDLFYKLALSCHIFSGFFAIITGFIAIISEKGKATHKKAGFIFFINMIVVNVSAIVISVIRENSFLLYVAIFTIYLVYSGYRSIKMRSMIPNIPDGLVLLFFMINAFLMISSMKVVLIVFGFISLYLSILDIRLFFSIPTKKTQTKNQWLLRHISMMMGSYIATLTAFLVVNIKLVNFPWITWLTPTIIGIPIIVFYRNKFTLKLKSQK